MNVLIFLHVVLLYCVTKGNISFCTLVLSLRAFFLSENLTSESVLSIRVFGKPLA